MGAVFSTKVVCAVAAYTYSISQYPIGSNFNFGYTGVVNGGSCGFEIDTAVGGDQIELFNTTGGLLALESVNCTVAAGATTCTTPFFNFSGVPFAFETLYAEEIYPGSALINGSTNFTYIALPPVPSQTPQPILIGGTTLQVTTSQYSAEYGFPLIGCVASAGVVPYAGADLPATLSATPSANSLPFRSQAFYRNTTAYTQSSTFNISLAALNLAPSTYYDFHWVCYNSFGKSFDTYLYNMNTSSSLPVPAAAPSASSSSAAVAAASSSSAAAAAVSSSSAAAQRSSSSATAQAAPSSSSAAASVSSSSAAAQRSTASSSTAIPVVTPSVTSSSSAAAARSSSAVAPSITSSSSAAVTPVTTVTSSSSTATVFIPPVATSAPIASTTAPQSSAVVLVSSSSSAVPSPPISANHASAAFKWQLSTVLPLAVAVLAGAAWQTVGAL